ncbi:major facilitator superfamily multidrug-resistance, DHA1 sub-family [Pholiota conissans]|uniref:Major facilitator superfamily multidrug-resistance, DHA1 sub-family n=1 Tax=Pholiota conissans TaxID=109636 RepID=A0A9P6D1U9_9AGAR|nr:major facilitator superfamily multidrug-resistance, DHA1 sub-family [Pholiota conissans]
MSLVEGPVHEETRATLYDDHDDDDELDDQDLEKPTPLPKFQLLSVFLIQLAEPITATVIYPFINQFVRETGITNGDEKKTGYYAGFIESTFFFSEALTVVQWGYLSDRYGRRPILLCGPLGLAFAMLFFGMSTTFWPLVAMRTLQGIFNGNIGVSKSMMAEMTDSTNRGDAFAYLPLIWGSGTTVGPIIGGLLSNPAGRWPDTLGHIAYLRSHPYFLPCAVAGIFSFATFLVSCFAMKETLPSIVARERLERHRKLMSDDVVTEDSQLLLHGESQGYGTGDLSASHYSTSSSGSSTVAGQSDSESSSPERKPDLQILFSRALVVTLINNVFLSFLDMCHVTLLPLMYSTSIPLGGLGLDPFSIGLVLGGSGALNAIAQAKFLGRFIRKYGAGKVYKVSFSCIIVCFIMYPLMSFFAKRAGRVDGFVIACMAVQLFFQSMIYAAYGSLQVLLVETVPEGGPMATVNGVAQMLGSGTRSFAPTFASSLFSISLQEGLAGGNMVYYIILGITLAGIRCTALLPKKRRRSKRRSQQQSSSS